jgi:hypothetical protein
LICVNFQAQIVICCDEHFTWSIVNPAHFGVEGAFLLVCLMDLLRVDVKYKLAMGTYMGIFLPEPCNHLQKRQGFSAKTRPLYDMILILSQVLFLTTMPYICLIPSSYILKHYTLMFLEIYLESWFGSQHEDYFGNLIINCEVQCFLIQNFLFQVH